MAQVYRNPRLLHLWPNLSRRGLIFCALLAVLGCGIDRPALVPPENTVEQTNTESEGAGARTALGRADIVGDGNGSSAVDAAAAAQDGSGRAAPADSAGGVAETAAPDAGSAQADENQGDTPSSSETAAVDAANPELPKAPADDVVAVDAGSTQADAAQADAVAAGADVAASIDSLLTPLDSVAGPSDSLPSPSDSLPSTADSLPSTADAVAADGSATTDTDSKDSAAPSPDTIVDIDAVVGPDLPVPTVTKGPIDGSPCDDGKVCTYNDRWSDGVCLGVWKACSDNQPCNASSCDPASGNCKIVKQTGGCDDGNPCTQGEACKSGASCSGGSPVDCSDGLPCTLDSCNPEIGCVHNPVPVGDKCATNSVCLASGACVISLACQGMPALCDDGESCTIDFCDAGAGCLHFNADDKSHCDDGDTCTPMATEKCISGKCTNKNNVCGCSSDTDCAQFDDGNLCNGVYHCAVGANGVKQCKPKVGSEIQCAPLGLQTCHQAQCDAVSGACLASQLGDGQWCDDGEPCSVKSQCAKGVCKGISSQNCDDNSPCTTDSCEPGKGCVYVKSAATVCALCGDCDDKNPCTVDTCAGSNCLHTAQTCGADGDPCLTAACVATGPTSWHCSLQPKLSVPKLLVDKACSIWGSNGSVWASDDSCPSGYQCTAPADKPESAKCVPKATVACTDGSACTVNDACNMGSCQSGPASGCDDDTPCTADTCGATGCLHTPIVGCSVCINEDFQTSKWATLWSSYGDAGDYVQWQVLNDPNGNGSQVAKWLGKAQENATQGAILVVQRLHLGPGVPAQIDFWYRTQLATATCGSDDVELWGNGILLWRQCESTPGGTTGAMLHAVIDLTFLAGSPVDLEFRAVASPDAKYASTIELDKVRIAGACTQACMGAHLEALSDARDVPSSPFPQGWKLLSTAPDYVS